MTNKRTILKTFTVRKVKESSALYELKNDGVIKSPYDAQEIFSKVFDAENMTKEHLMLASLNTKNKVVALHIVHIGSISASIVHPREIFQLALLDNATSIILAHNHPSGDPEPSREDIHVTKRISECGKLMGIELLDHIIIGDNCCLSLKEKGYI